MKSRDYWKARATALEYYIQQDASKTRDEIMKLYAAALKNIDEEIAGIRGELGKVTGIVSKAELEELLSKAERDNSYRELQELLELAEDDAERADIMNRINAQAYGTRITRADAVGNKILAEFTKATAKEQTLCRELFTEAYQEAYYTNIYNLAEGYNTGVAFDVLPRRAIQEALQEPWEGANYSERIWNHSQAFTEQVEQTVVSGLMSGKSRTKMARELDTFAANDIYYVKERLVRTETAHFLSQGQKKAYDAAEIEKYRYIAALSERTCEICSALDNKVFLVTEATPGVNYPTMHPNCRCITITGDAALKTRIARDPVTGKNYKVDGSMDFQQWKDSLSEEQKQAFDLHVRQNRNKSSDQKQYQRYVKRLGAENMPKTFDKFQTLKYTDVGKYGTLKRGYRTLGEIERKDQWSDAFKKKAVDAYWEFNQSDVEMSSHALARFLDRSKNSFTMNDIIEQAKKPFNYIEPDKKCIKFYNDIAVIYNEQKIEVVSLVKRKKPSERWVLYDD